MAAVLPRRMLESRLVVLAVATLVAVATASSVGAVAGRGPRALETAADCRLGGGVAHVVYLQFDNVHLSRDVPSVPSDLEQMPHLLHFLEDNGTVVAGSHTSLVAHTAGDLLTSVTGLYPDQDGQGVSNSWRYLRPDGGLGTGNSFTYWTSRVYDTATATPSDRAYNLVTAAGRNTPAPWVPFTRAGCDVGSVGGPAGLALVNAADVAAVFGGASPEAHEARTNPRAATAAYLGLAVHCAATSSLCSAAAGGRPDLLPDEPGGYGGFRALFGSRFLAPRVPVSPFPGVDAMTPAAALPDVAAMQEHGVPVTFAYLSDAHDPRDGSRAFGPGEPGYEAQLHAYDRAFADFISRIARDGLNAENTLFVVGADEGDLFVGSAPQPEGCDGVHVPCHYAMTGEVRVNLPGLLAGRPGAAPFALHDDAAPAVWVAGDTAPTSPPVRQLERSAGSLTVTNPYTGAREALTEYAADRAELRLLHMTAGDAARVPSLVLFASPGYFVASGPASCAGPCVTVDGQSAYDHGGVDPAVNTTWFALAGPGVSRKGLDATVWADEADLRPTLLALTGLRDSYPHDGRVLSEVLARPLGAEYEELAAALKRIDAPLGPLALASLAAATRAVESDTSQDAAYLAYQARAASLLARRDALAGRMRDQLEAAAFAGGRLSTEVVAGEPAQADALVTEAWSLSS
jgi:hypothetical protein